MRLRNAPLVHVLAEIRFSQVLSIEKYVPAIQEALRELGYPWLVEGTIQTVTVVAEAPPQVSIRPQWAFLQADKTTGVVLSEASLVLHTTQYSTLEPFLAGLQQVVAVLAQVARIDLVERIGMRYLDRIPPDEDGDLAPFVVPGLAGFPMDDMGSLGALQTETAGRTPDGVLVVRSMLLPPGQIVPPDLDPAPVVYPTAERHDAPALALDFDHYTVFETEVFLFDSELVVQHARKLHTALRRAFDVAVTPYAIERWGPWEEV